MKRRISMMSVAAAALVALPALANMQHDDEVKAWTDSYFQAVDTEGNGYITKDEFMNHAEKRFTEMDADNDGNLSKEEVMNFKMKEHDEWKTHHHARHTGGTNRPNATRGSHDRPDANEDVKTNSGNTSRH